MGTAAPVTWSFLRSNGFAESHRPFRKGSVDRVLGCGAEPNPFISETSCDTARDHRLQHIARNFKADAVHQLTACAHVLQRAQIAAFVLPDQICSYVRPSSRAVLSVFSIERKQNKRPARTSCSTGRKVLQEFECIKHREHTPKKLNQI